MSRPFPEGDLAPGPVVVRQFAHYLERTLADADAGRAQVLWHPFAPLSVDAAVTVRIGPSTARRDAADASRSGARVAFRGNAGRGPARSARRIPVTVFDRWDPAMVAPTPPGFDVLAVVATFNEADVVEDMLRRLREDGIRVHVIDNWSTDGTFPIVSSRVAKDDGVTVERFPADAPSEYFALETLLARVEAIAHESGADWVVNHDADEVRQSPWSGVSLRRGLWCVEQFGFNCVDHTLMNFRPVDERWDGNGSGSGNGSGRLGDAFFWFEFGDHHAAFRHQKAWKPQAVPVRFASSGGHDADFPGRRVFPYRFLLRHYPIRSTAHGRRKVLTERQGRFSPDERERGWHVHYDHYSDESEFLWQPEVLHRFTTLEDLDRRLLLERLSGVGLPANPFPGESIDPSAPPPLFGRKVTLKGGIRVAGRLVRRVSGAREVR